jgi:hypothetical protein
MTVRVLFHVLVARVGHASVDPAVERPLDLHGDALLLLVAQVDLDVLAHRSSRAQRLRAGER